MNKQPRAVLSLSGGMDSSSLLLRLLREGHKVTALSFDYGQKHAIELEKAKELVEYINSKTSIEERVLHQVIDLSSLTPLLESALVTGGQDVPEGHYENENMKLTVVPNRNKIFSSIIQAVALSIANRVQGEVRIAMGIHAGDHAIYPDCRQTFRDADYHAFLLGNWDSERVIFDTPYLEFDKADILLDGEISCGVLGLDFDEVYKRTLTSYKPIYDKLTDQWYSDFYSASSVERVEAFMKLDRTDPAIYAELTETGSIVRDWDYVVACVNEIISRKSMKDEI